MKFAVILTLQTIHGLTNGKQKLILLENYSRVKNMLEKIWPNSFTHWNVKSTKRNAVLCKVTKISKELGLFWKFQSPNAEFTYLPAVFQRDDKGQIKMTSGWAQDRAFLVDYGRVPQDSRRKSLYYENTEDFDFHFNFKEGEAKTYAELLKQVDRGTEEFRRYYFCSKN